MRHEAERSLTPGLVGEKAVHWEGRAQPGVGQRTEGKPEAAQQGKNQSAQDQGSLHAGKGQRQ